MAYLLPTACPFCPHKDCVATPLTRELLNSIKRKSKEIFDGIISMSIFYAFCTRDQELKMKRILN